MRAVESLAYSYEVPVLSAVKAEYGRWKCGPASILLVNLMSEDTGIPVVVNNADRRRECFELDLYVYQQHEEHTAAKYNSGRGFSLSIDLLYRLLWGGHNQENGAALIEWHYDHQLYADLDTTYNLQPALHTTPLKPRIGFCEGLGETNSTQDLVDLLSIMSSPQAFEETAVATSGRIVDLIHFGQRLVRAKRQVRNQISPGALWTVPQSS
jgi:hypothetical protein